MTSAVVFAYHDVGVRCLSVILAAGVDVRLVVTHEDNPAETIWFESVAQLARRHGLEVTTDYDAHDDRLFENIARIHPEFIFSFYFRHLLPARILAAARRGALNMHGSLLPKYRGRVPVNWAVIRGEAQTGATLHYMTEKPDAGDIVDQMAVPILPDDTAVDVFRKVTCAAELTLHRAIAPLISGTAARRAQDLASGSYFGARRPEHGRIDWSRPAREIHDLVRGVAPPYPGAFFDAGPHRVRVLATRCRDIHHAPGGAARLERDADACLAVCGDGRVLQLLDIELDGERIAPCALADALGEAAERLAST